MAELLFITETGMLHSACRVTFGTFTSLEESASDLVYGVAPKWYGFKPCTNLAPIGKGKVDNSDRSSFINHSIKFSISDRVIKPVIDNVASEFANATYVVGITDCVTFTAEVARRCGLGVPLLNFTPYGFLQILAVHNSYVSKT